LGLRLVAGDGGGADRGVRLRRDRGRGGGDPAAADGRGLVAACQMGLHRYLDRILSLIEQNVAEDPAFASLTPRIGQLMLLWRAGEPLEAHGLAQVPALARTAYRRACGLVPDLAATPAEETRAVLEALGGLREVLAGGHEELFDRDLFVVALGVL